MVYGIASGGIGARLLWLFSNLNEINNPLEIASIWEGGLSVLGSIIGVLCMLTVYLSRHKIPLLPFLDLIATYAPLLQSIARLGCFFAGCCYGKICTQAWGIVYTDLGSFAPLNQALHPTQLYSAGALFALFILLVFMARNLSLRTGSIFSFYLAGAGLERFVVDFFRADQEWLPGGLRLFSLHQCIALGLVACGLVIYILIARAPSVNRKALRHE